MKKLLIPILLTASLLLAGCSTGGTEKSTAAASIQTTVQTDATTAAETTAAEATSAETTAAVDLILPITENTSGKVMIQTVSKSYEYPFNSYIISSVEGENVVVDPTAMPSIDIVDIHPAAICCTHPHPDHVSETFTNAYDCPKILFLRGDVTTEDFHIYSIPSSHSDDVVNEDTYNVIIVFEVDGLRIAHMGDIGQTVLTDGQLEEIGEIDIAFMQFENSYSDMSLENMKGFTLIEQLNPTIVIPTHYTDEAKAMLEEKYGTITEYENVMTMTKEDLPEGTLNVCIITNTHTYK